MIKTPRPLFLKEINCLVITLIFSKIVRMVSKPDKFRPIFSWVY